MIVAMDLIAKLAAKLLDELGAKSRTGVSKGEWPPEIKKRVDSYNMFKKVWSAADDDILALVAVGELMWEKAILPVKTKNEERLQLDYGVNVFLKGATQIALAAMKKDRDALRTMKLKCEAMRPLADALAARALMGGPMNASQIQFDRLGATEVKRVCRQNEQALGPILSRFDSIIEINEKVLDAHR